MNKQPMNKISLPMLAAALATMLSGCTTVPGAYSARPSTPPADKLASISITRPLEVAAGTARVWLGDAAERYSGVRCYVETKAVRPDGSDAVVVAAGEFSVLPASRTSTPLSLSRIKTLNVFSDTPSFYNTRYSLRMAPGQRDDVLAFHCVETFLDTSDAHYPSLQDLQQQAGDALSF